MDKLEKEAIEGLSEPARRLFFSLDTNGKKRILKKAKELSKQNERKKRQKRRFQNMSNGKKNEKKKVENRKGSFGKSGGAFSIYEKSKQNITEGMSEVMQVMLMGQSTSEQGYGVQGTENDNEKNDTYVPRQLVGAFGQKARTSMTSHLRKKSAQKTYQSTKQGAKFSVKSMQETVENVGKTLRKTVSSAIKVIATNPVVWIGLLIVLLVVVIVAAIGAAVGSGGAANSEDNYTYQAQVSEQTESYREMVSTYCEKYGIDDYVDLCLAVIEQESGGNPPDVMQTEQSYYNVNPPIDTAEESIDCGTHQLSDCLTNAKCKSPNDIAKISLALQGYNFGNGYIEWAINNYQGYTLENAKIFSQKMCADLGYSTYGDVEYVPHVFRYYVANGPTLVSNEPAKNILQELKENNSTSGDRWEVIEKGASLIGRVQYSMEQRQADGRDNPVYLDCSSFTAWSFHKAGITSVPYWSNTATFISSSKFMDIEANDLQPGDIGLKSKTAATGGANHVGIYCGELKNGTKVWLHCTSSSGTSLTGNDSGVMFGSYTNFTYFRRLK